MIRSLSELVRLSGERGLPMWRLIQEDECRERSIEPDVSFREMRGMYLAMRGSLAAYDPALTSASGLVGGEGAKLQRRREAGLMLAGDFLGRVMESALKVSESNACMRRIVAAPTAGSCGVLPAVLLTVQDERGFSDDTMTEALYTAAGIGGVIALRASLSGAVGGCQAEIGSASAMAAGSLAYLLGGDAHAIANAAALALKNLLGLACDPVAGLVEVPCVKRNVMGAVNAVTSADLAMAGIESRIPPDEVIDAMRAIGRGMSESIRETGAGGLAATPAGIEMRNKMSM